MVTDHWIRASDQGSTPVQASDMLTALGTATIMTNAVLITAGSSPECEIGASAA